MAAPSRDRVSADEVKVQVLLTEPIDLEQIADCCAGSIPRIPPKTRDYSAWHVSNLLESARHIVKGDIRYHEYEGHPLGIMSLGRVWEAAVDAYLTRYAKQQGGYFIPDVELDADGIVGSLDGVLCLPKYGTLVSESKLRFTISPEIPLSHLQQVRSYCHLLGTDLVCYVSGHVASNPPCALGTMRIIRFTRQSIEECWQGIVNTKTYLEKMGCGPQAKAEKSVKGGQ